MTIQKTPKLNKIVGQMNMDPKVFFSEANGKSEKDGERGNSFKMICLYLMLIMDFPVFSLEPDC